MKKVLLLLCLIMTILPLAVSCGDNNLSNSPEQSGSTVKLSAEEIYEKVASSVVTINAVSQSSSSSGTGFFCENGSTIVTNYHVIKDCSIASITLSNGKEYDVLTVLGYDEEKDIAILKVDYKNGQPLDIRTSDVKTGETVYAIGNPLGFLGGSLSEGIVSTAKREIEGQIYIQTTASVTHGNSGGPLIDSYGNVIGIVSAGFGDGLDLNLAIPIARVNEISISTPMTLHEIVVEKYFSDYITCSVEELYRNPQKYNGKNVAITSWNVICNLNEKTAAGTFYDLLLCDDLTHYEDKSNYPLKNVAVYTYYKDCIQPFNTPYIGAHIKEYNIYTNISKTKSKMTLYGFFTYNPTVSEGGYIGEPHVFHIDVDYYTEW